MDREKLKAHWDRHASTMRRDAEKASKQALRIAIDGKSRPFLFLGDTQRPGKPKRKLSRRENERLIRKKAREEGIVF